MSDVTTPAEVTPDVPAPLPSIAELKDRRDDDSYVTDIKLVAKSVERYMDAVPVWIKGDDDALAAKEAAAESIMDLRSSIELANGYPDWAGNSRTYALAFEQRVTRAAVAAGIDAARFADFRGNLRVWMNSVRYADRYIARYIVKTTPNIGATVVGKGDGAKTVKEIVDAAVKDGKIPQPVKSELTKHYKAQLDSSNNRLPGFKVTPDRFGVKPPPVNPAAKAGNTGQNTPAKSWEQARNDVGKIATVACVEQLDLTVTALQDDVVGIKGKAAARKEIQDRAKVVETLRELANHVVKLADYLDSTVTGITKDDILKLRRED